MLSSPSWYPVIALTADLSDTLSRELDGVTRIITFADIAAGSPHLSAWWAQLELALPAVASRAAAVRVLPEHAGHCCNCKYCEEAVFPKLDEQEDASDRPIAGRLYWNLSASVSVRAFATALVTGIGVVRSETPEARDEMARVLQWAVEVGDQQLSRWLLGRLPRRAPFPDQDITGSVSQAP